MSEQKYSDCQLVFWRVKEHLLKQNRRSRGGPSGTEGCAYRGDNGAMCAIGCLIPNADYSLDLENTSIVNYDDQYREHIVSIIRKEYPFATDSLLGDLQHIHDKTPVVQWPAALNEFSGRYKVLYDRPTP